MLPVMGTQPQSSSSFQSRLGKEMRNLGSFQEIKKDSNGSYGACFPCLNHTVILLLLSGRNWQAGGSLVQVFLPPELCLDGDPVRVLHPSPFPSMPPQWCRGWELSEWLSVTTPPPSFPSRALLVRALSGEWSGMEKHHLVYQLMPHTFSMLCIYDCF